MFKLVELFTSENKKTMKNSIVHIFKCFKCKGTICLRIINIFVLLYLYLLYTTVIIIIIIIIIIVWCCKRIWPVKQGRVRPWNS